MKSLKLFRSTGYESLFGPGETRLSVHPAWIIVSACLWLGLVCNPPLWSTWQGSFEPRAIPTALAVMALLAGALAVALGALAWGRSLKLWMLLALASAAWLTAQLWAQNLSLDTLLGSGGLTRLWGAPWTPWQLLATLPLLVLPHALWLHWVPLKRLSAKGQVRLHLGTLVLGAAASTLALAWLNSEQGLLALR